MIPVEKAQTRLLALAPPLPSQNVSLEQAIGRYLAKDLVANRCQPATDLSAMDGYAIRFSDLPGPFSLIGESAAGSAFTGTVGCLQTARIFTGAPVPDGADTILVQEDAISEVGIVSLTGDGPNQIGKHIRREASDFCEGDILVQRGELLHAGAIAAAAMAGYGELSIGGVPRVKIIATGDELVAPGGFCDAAHIPSSNNVMLQALLKSLPCLVTDAGIVKDDLENLKSAFEDAQDYDVIVTSGGASVGDHDLVQAALKAIGAEIDFWRVAIRPGKPLMAGRVGTTILLGLPGNPSSAFVTAILFLLPLVRHLAGSTAPYPVKASAAVTKDLGCGDNRAEYMRASVKNGEITPFGKQDSGMLKPLVEANALLVRPIQANSLKVGDLAPYLAL